MKKSIASGLSFINDSLYDKIIKEKVPMHFPMVHLQVTWSNGDQEEFLIPLEPNKCLFKYKGQSFKSSQIGYYKDTMLVSYGAAVNLKKARSFTITHVFACIMVNEDDISHLYP